MFIEDSGLTMEKFETIGGSPEILADITAKHFHAIPVIGSALAIFVQGATQLFLKTSLGSRVSRRTAEAFPLGYFLVAQNNQVLWGASILFFGYQSLGFPNCEKQIGFQSSCVCQPAWPKYRAPRLPLGGPSSLLVRVND